MFALEVGYNHNGLKQGGHLLAEKRPSWNIHPASEIKVVLFDWELTLARAMGDVSTGERLAVLFQMANLPYTVYEVQIALQSYEADVKSGRVRGYLKPQTQEEVGRFYQELLGRLGYGRIGHDLCDRLYDSYAELPTFLYDDALPTLKALKDRGYTLGIISNHTTLARNIMHSTVGAYIEPEHIVISQEVGVHKPAAPIFWYALAKVGFSAKNCLFVGDNLEVDAVGAVQYGGLAQGLWLDRFETGPDVVLPQKIHRITSLLQVLSLVS